MDNSPKYISEAQQEVFERFLMDEMPMDERKSFEVELIQDERLQNSFDEFKALFEMVEETGLRTKLEDFHRRFEKKQETPVVELNNPKFKFNYRIAASIAVLMTIGGLWFFNRANPNEQLYDQYYTQDPGLPTVMGSSDNYDFYEAMVDYKQGKYEIAIEKWKKLLAEKPGNDTLNYFLGSAYLAKENDKNAIPFLLEVTEFKESFFDNEAHFYLGLIYLKQEKIKDAKESFEKSSLSKSREILSDLK